MEIGRCLYEALCALQSGEGLRGRSTVAHAQYTQLSALACHVREKGAGLFYTLGTTLFAKESGLQSRNLNTVSCAPILATRIGATATFNKATFAAVSLQLFCRTFITHSRPNSGLPSPLPPLFQPTLFVFLVRRVKPYKAPGLCERFAFGLVVAGVQEERSPS